MNSKYTFSIMIVTYNPIWEKLKLTLDAIIEQNFKDYELIIVDDGSKNNLENEICSYMHRNPIKNFRHIKNEVNQGTVRNIISGLCHCSGEYVKVFGPGDYFAANDSLETVYSYLKKNKLDVCWGLVKSYVNTPNGKREFVYRAHPLDIEAYRKYDVERIRENLIYYSDSAHGASIFIKTEKFRHYLDMIVPYVRYAEDLIQIPIALDEEPIHLLNEEIICYEVGEGISTAKKSGTYKLLERDVHDLYEMLEKNYPENRYLIKRKRIEKFYAIKNLYLRTMCRFFVNPGMVIFLTRALGQRIRHRHY